MGIYFNDESIQINQFCGELSRVINDHNLVIKMILIYNKVYQLFNRIIKWPK